MRAKSMRQLQMRRASRTVRHIEKRPKLLDVHRRTWKRFQQPNVALPSSQWRSARARRRARERSAVHDANPQIVDAKSNDTGFVAETPAGLSRPPRTRATHRASRTPACGSTPHTASALADGSTFAPSQAGVSSRKCAWPTAISCSSTRRLLSELLPRSLETGLAATMTHAMSTTTPRRR